jgi:hypothetical protein
MRDGAGSRFDSVLPVAAPLNLRFSRLAAQEAFAQLRDQLLHEA